MSFSSNSSAALPLPPGQVSNFVDPPSIQPAIIGGLTVCLAASTLSAILRYYAQKSLFKKLFWADFWMLLGWSFQVAFVAFLFACLPYGAGRHQWDVTKSDFRQISFLLFIDFILYDIAILGPKISILLQLQAIFVPRGHGIGRSASWFFWASLSLAAVNLVFYIALSFALMFQCSPIAKGWDPTIPGHCLDQDSLLESSGPFNIISDFLIFLLPLFAIWRLHLPVKTRLGVASAFAVGFFGCICSAVRLYYSNKLNSSGDATYLIFQNQLWANAEITTALLISNIIIVPRFIRFKRGIGSSHEHGTRSSGRNNTISRSKVLRRGHDFMQRIPSNEPQIELQEHAYYTLPITRSGLNEEHRLEEVPTSGILRSIQVDTIEEMVDMPARPARYQSC